MHFSPSQWTPRQRLDHEANIVLTAMLQVALLFMGRSKDQAALQDLFQETRWQRALQQYHALFVELFDDVIPLEHLHYHPRADFYESVARSLADQGSTPELLSLYMVSGSNAVLHQDPEALQLSQRVNSKMHFARTAPQAGLPVPASLVVSCAEIEGAAVADFFTQHARAEGLMVKVQGLAGSRSVAQLHSVPQAVEFVAGLDSSVEVLFQERLDLRKYTEMTVDLTISDNAIEITNVRKILFADGLWVGNFISDSLELTPRQRARCLQVGRYVREQGYVRPEGLNCGIDFFVPNDPADDDLIVIEINARWTGGLFPAHLLERLQLQSHNSVAFIDVVSEARFDDYLDFIAAHVQGSKFRALPMGFSPFVQVIDGLERLYVWQVVTGDFAAFRAAKNQQLGATELPTADLIEGSP
ncbi:MAG: hypothetical protein AB8B93_05660 [Pseudomonadales bacterium]